MTVKSLKGSFLCLYIYKVYVVYVLFQRCIFNILHENESIIITNNGSSVVQNSS